MKGEASNRSVGHISRQSEGYNNDLLFPQASDHPSMDRTTIKVNGSNFQQWNRSMKIALHTRTKLGFIDGSCKKPESSSAIYEQWIRCDSMVVNWLLNSIAHELSKAFAELLWLELLKRSGQNNGPLLYQLQKEISEMHQGNDSVAIYYTKLKQPWDELDDLSEVLICD